MGEEMKVIELFLKECNENLNGEISLKCDGFTRNAIEILLNDYKKTKQELESVKEIYYTQGEVDKHYIPKAKVTETIRKYQKRRLELANGNYFADPNYINNDTALVIGISVLQDLLQNKGGICYDSCSSNKD